LHTINKFFLIVFLLQTLSNFSKAQEDIKKKIESEKYLINNIIINHAKVDDPRIIAAVVFDYKLFKNNGIKDYNNEILFRIHDEVDWGNTEKYQYNIAEFFAILADYYFQKKDLESTERVLDEAIKILNNSKKNTILRISYERLLFSKFAYLGSQNYNKSIDKFVKNDWKLFKDYLDEFKTLPIEEQTKIINIEPNYLYRGYYAISVFDSLYNFSGNRSEYSKKALNEINLNPKIDKSLRINNYTTLLLAAILDDDTSLQKETLAQIKEFIIESKKNEKNLTSIKNNFSLLFKLYQMKNLENESNDLLNFIDSKYKVSNSNDLTYSELGFAYNLLFAKSEIERKRHNYKMSLFYLNEITKIKEFNIEEIIKKNGKINLQQASIILELVPNLCDLYFKLNMTNEIKKMSKILAKVEIEDITNKELNGVEGYYNPLRILDPLFAYYVQTNNLEKANLVADYLDNNFSKIFKKNYTIEPSDLTRNLNDYLKLNKKNLVYKISDYTNSLIIQKYNDSFYDSIWKFSGNHIDSTIELFELSSQLNSKEFFDKIYSTAQIIKNSNISREVLRSYISKKINNEEILEYQNLKNELINIEKNNNFKLSAITNIDEIDSALEKNYDEKIQKLHKLEINIRDKYPEYFKLSSVSGVKLSDIQNKLNSNEAVIDYYFGDQKFAIIIIKKNSYSAYINKIPFTDINNLKNKIRKTLSPTTTGILPFDLKDSYKLNQILFLSIKNQLKDINRLYIIPDGPLNQIPLYALPKNDGTECKNCSKISWNLDDYTFSYLASYENFIYPEVDNDIQKIFKENFSKISKTLEKNEIYHLIKDEYSKVINNDDVHQKNQQYSYLGVGDPDLYSNNSDTGSKLDFERFLRSVGTNKVIEPKQIKQFYKPVLGSKDEINYAAKIFGITNSKILLKKDATVTNIKNLDLTKFNILHFATHADISGVLKGINQPFLVLSPPTNPSEFDNGILTMNEIMQLNTKADIVILSACNTGAAEDTYSGNYSGLAKAFFVSGSKSVLVSNWKVETKSTQKLISKFIKNFSSNDLSYSENLRLSMEEFSKENSDLSHPIFWAPFVFVGNDREINKTIN